MEHKIIVLVDDISLVDIQPLLHNTVLTILDIQHFYIDTDNLFSLNVLHKDCRNGLSLTQLKNRLTNIAKCFMNHNGFWELYMGEPETYFDIVVKVLRHNDCNIENGCNKPLTETMHPDTLENQTEFMIFCLLYMIKYLDTKGKEVTLLPKKK